MEHLNMRMTKEKKKHLSEDAKIKTEQYYLGARQNYTDRERGAHLMPIRTETATHSRGIGKSRNRHS